MDVVLSREKVWLTEEKKGGLLSLLGSQNRAEIRIGGKDDAVLVKSPCQDLLVLRGLQPVCTNMHGVMSGNPEQLRQTRGQCIVDEELQAE